MRLGLCRLWRLWFGDHLKATASSAALASVIVQVCESASAHVTCQNSTFVSSCLLLCIDLGGCCPTGTLCCQYGFCLRPGYTCCPNQPCAPGSVCCGGGCYPQGGDCCDNSSYCGPGSHCGKNWWQVTQCYRDLTIEEARNITKNLEDKILGGSVRGRPSWQGGSLGIICAILLPLYLLP